MNLFDKLAGALTKDERRDVYIQMSEELLELKLLVWEESFVRSLIDWMGNGNYLTPKQMNKLEQIYSRVKYPILHLPE